MLNTLTIDIAAPPTLVFELARNVRRWEVLLPHYARSRALRSDPDGALVVDFVALRPLVGLLGLGLPVAWRARTWSEPDAHQLRFVHLAGATRGMDVTWRIEAVGPNTRVFIDHLFRPRLPGFATFIDRGFIRPIARRTLVTFKALAESLAAGPEKSDLPARANDSP